MPDELAEHVRVGTIVRVPLHGRRVRGWLVADDVDPEADPVRLRPIAEVVSAGPPSPVVELCQWAAWRYAGPVAPLLRAASPPNVVPPLDEVESDAAVFPPGGPVPGLEALATSPRGLVAWPPAADLRELVRELLAPEGSTIVVVPDAARLPVLLAPLHDEGRHAVMLRSEDRDAHRTRMWDAARSGACVVVGGRLAVLAPVPDLRGVVVLDEGDEALKEERAPTWNARELALERGRRAHAPVRLVSPAPTLDAEAAAGPLLRPPRSVEREGWPHLVVVDPSDEPPGRGILSDALAAALRQTLERRERAVCVLNRKGRARLLSCHACHQLVRCEVCGAAVVERDGHFGCPRCTTTRPHICIHCFGTRFVRVRPGITRVREELAALLPRARVAEVDASTERLPVADVLVGTEAVLHRIASTRATVGLVAFLEFDQELLASRYRAAEQAMWLVVRAARLVGGRRGRGRVLVQTRVPDHEVVAAVRAADPTIVIDAERTRRRALGFPPFGALAEVSGAPAAVEVACQILRARPELTVLGPTATGSRARALVRAVAVDALCDALAAVDLTPARAHGRVRVEVGPLRV